MQRDTRCWESHTTGHTLPISDWQGPSWVSLGKLDLMGSEFHAPDPVGRLMRGGNGGMRLAIATFSKVDAHMESTPVARNTRLFTAGSETRVPDPVEGVGFGINGGRMMGYLVGDKVSTPKTPRSDGGVQSLSATAYGNGAHGISRKRRIGSTPKFFKC